MAPKRHHNQQAAASPNHPPPPTRGSNNNNSSSISIVSATSTSSTSSNNNNLPTSSSSKSTAVSLQQQPSAKKYSSSSSSSASHGQDVLVAIWKRYVSETPQRVKLLDTFMAFLVLVGALQFVYCVLVGNYVSLFLSFFFNLLSLSTILSFFKKNIFFLRMRSGRGACDRKGTDLKIL